MKIGAFLKRISKATMMTMRANIGNLHLWFVVAFLAIGCFAVYVAAVQVAGVPDSSVQESVKPGRTPASGFPDVEQAKKCFPTYTHLEWKVYESLGNGGWAASSDQSTIVGLTSTKMSACAVQRKVLDYLSRYPRDQRSEVLAGIVDAIERH
jgi:hypothetical protein